MSKITISGFRKLVRTELNTLCEFYLGSDKVVGRKFKFNKPTELSNGKTYGAEDTWIITKAVDDDHYCTNTNTGEKDIFHTDVMMSDTNADLSGSEW